jgi:hypothetical protein
MADVNYASELSRILADRLRQNVNFTYNFSEGRATVTIGMASYLGNVAATPRAQRQSACRQAYIDLVHRTETSIRMRLGMPPRQHLRQVDRIRDQLRLLRQEARDLPNANDKRRARMQIGRAYTVIDQLETDLMRFGVPQ